LGRQDYEVAALVHGLIYIGDQGQAKNCLEDYARHRRRDLIPLSNDLRSISEVLGVPESERPASCRSVDRTEGSARST